MAPRGEKEIDPEILMRKKFLAKCRFRALGRYTLANVYWLAEDHEVYEGVHDVRRRVEQAVRRKFKTKQLLTITDKALLNKPAADRTDHEKKYLYRKIGGLKCFKRYPDKVKRKLAAATYFRYYGPGRVVIREGHVPLAMYFIVTGAITITKLVYDELFNTYVPVEVGTQSAGDIFGDVSLLHNIPRTATCTTTSHCELLTLFKEDFKDILQTTVQREWDEVRAAMLSFTYFEGLDEVIVREGCIVAKMKTYETDETIFGDGVGIANYVYFVLTGQCQMIESLNVSVTKRGEHIHYKLYDPYVPKKESVEEMFHGKIKSAQLVRSPTKSSLGNIKDSSVAVLSGDLSVNRESSGSISMKSFKSFTNKVKSVLDPITEDTEHQKPEEAPKITKSQALSKKQLLIVDEKDAKSGCESTLFIPDVNSIKSLRMFSDAPQTRLSNIRTYFMQVCLFNPGSTFGFGENMRDRRIIALTPVSCMLIPKVWLLQYNTANIWTRIEHYLNKAIPTKKKMFESFVLERQWEEFREERIEDVIARAHFVNWTSVHDVPYSIRLEEMFDV